MIPRFLGARRRLIEELQRKGIHDLAVLKAFDEVPRHLFVPSGVRHRAYEDAALPIGHGQTISQPWVHARYLQSLGLKGTERVLEIGTGSGFQTALLSRIAHEVYSIERIPELVDEARRSLRASGAGQDGRVHIMVGDGTLGWPEHAPFDAILVGAASPDVPKPLVDQLAVGGQLLVPVGDREEQVLKRVIRSPEGTELGTLEAMRFVPLIGTHGFRD